MKIEKFRLSAETKKYKPSAPFPAKVVSNKCITDPQSSDVVHHITIDISGSGMQYLEGQSVGVIPKHIMDNNERIKVRLYSVASHRQGDNRNGKTMGLCIKKLEEGSHSPYICNTKPDDTVYITGPVGRNFLLPIDKNTDIIMFATGTGIAPYRGFIDYICEQSNNWKGKCSLFFGCRSHETALYLNSMNNDLENFGEIVEIYRAYSRIPENNEKKMYIYHRLEENIEKIWNVLQKNNFCSYICGIKGLELSLDDVFSNHVKKQGLDWLPLKKIFVQEGRWNIEVY